MDENQTFANPSDYLNFFKMINCLPIRLLDCPMVSYDIEGTPNNVQMPFSEIFLNGEVPSSRGSPR